MSLERVQEIALDIASFGDGLYPTDMMEYLTKDLSVTPGMARQALCSLFEQHLIELSGNFKLVATPLGLSVEQHRMDPIPPQPPPKPKADKPKHARKPLSLGYILSRLEDSDIGDIMIGVGAGLNAVKEARKKRRGAEIDAEDFEEDNEEDA